MTIAALVAAKPLRMGAIPRTTRSMPIMTAISFVGKCFPTARECLDYLHDIKFGTAWRPRFVTMHHTGGP